MNYELGKYFYNLYLVALRESNQAYDADDYKHFKRALKRATRMCETANLLGYTGEDYQLECWEDEGLI